MTLAVARKQAPDSASKAKRDGAHGALPNPRRTRNSFPVPVVQRKPSCACGGRCPRCEEHHASANPETAPPIVHEVLRSPGRPLDPATRAFMEPRFGHDFSQVRVHTDARAANSARTVDAAAYVVGQDMVFGAGRYAPETGAGRKLLTHELTHVVQQRNAAEPPQLILGVHHSGLEAEAHVAAMRVAAGEPAGSLSRATMRTVQRAEPDESLGVLDSPITSLIASAVLGRERSWLLLREVLRGAVMGVRAEVATGRDEAIIARFRDLVRKPSDLSELHIGYLIGIGKGLVSPITDVFDLLKLALDVQRWAIRWFLTQGARLVANLGQRSAKAQALLDQLNLVAQRASKALTRVLLLLSNPLTAIPLVEALLDTLAQAALGPAREAGRKISLSIFKFLELPWRQFGEQVGFVVGAALIEILLGVLTSGIGNIIRNIIRVMGRGARLVAGQASRMFRLLKELAGELLKLVRKAPKELTGDLTPDMEHLVKLAEPIFDDIAAAIPSGTAPTQHVDIPAGLDVIPTPTISQAATPPTSATPTLTPTEVVTPNVPATAVGTPATATPTAPPTPDVDLPKPSPVSQAEDMGTLPGQTIKTPPEPGAPGSPEHKAARWAEYQARTGGKGLKYQQWSNVYEANMQNAARANRAVDAYHKEIGWGRREVTIDVEGVPRRLDIADEATLRGIEHKTGKQSLTKDNKWEVARDEILVQRGWDITWVFEGTASQPLLAALKAAGIKYFFR